MLDLFRQAADLIVENIPYIIGCAVMWGGFQFGKYYIMNQPRRPVKPSTPNTSKLKTKQAHLQ